MLSKRKLLIIVLSLLASLVLLLVFIQRRSFPNQLQSSDVVATNLQFTDNFHQEEGSLSFYTGTSVAKFNLTKPKSKFMSDAITKDYPFNEVDKISRGDNYTLVRTNYFAKENIITFGSGSDTESLEDGKIWAVTKDGGDPRALPIEDHTKISDAIIIDKMAYILQNVEGNKQALLLLDLEKFELSTLIPNLEATTFIGGKNDRVILRDYDGRVYQVLGKTLTTLAEGVGEVYYDNQTDTLIYTKASDLNQSEEGGQFSNTKNESRQVYFVNLSSGKKKDAFLDASALFVSRGYLIGIAKRSQPDSIVIYSLSNGSKHSIKIDHAQSKVVNPIKNMHLINNDASLIAVTTNNNQLILYGTSKYIGKTSYASSPKIPASISEYGLERNIATNRLTIYYPPDQEAEKIVSKSLGFISSGCECDVNQLSKRWLPTSDEPSL